MAVAAAEAAGLRSKLLATEVKSALCICPPQALWPSIQGVRERMDKSYLRWMPHINVAYPFVGAGRAEEAASVLRSAFRSAGIAEFSVALDSAGYFQHSKKSSTLWLAPRVVDGGEPVSASARRRSGNCCADVRLGIRHRSDALHVAMPQDVLDRLQRAVQGAIPACSHLRERGGDGQFRPHLSLAQLGAPRQATAALAELLGPARGRRQPPLCARSRMGCCRAGRRCREAARQRARPQQLPTRRPMPPAQLGQAPSPSAQLGQAPSPSAQLRAGQSRARRWLPAASPSP